jgi:hypothetical protein
MIDRPEAILAEEEADKTLKRVFRSINRNKLKELTLAADDPLQGAYKAAAGTPMWDLIEADLMEDLLGHFEDKGGEKVFGDDAIHHLWGMARVQSSRGFGYNIANLSSASPGFADLWGRAHAKALLTAADEVDVQSLLTDTGFAKKTVAEMSVGEQVKFNQALAGLFGQRGAEDRLNEMLETDITETAVRERIATTRDVRGRRAAQGANHARQASGKVTGAGSWKGMNDYYKRFATSDLGQVLDTKLGRAGAMGIGLMGAIGVIHAVNKRDRAPEDMGGPPHLPGGTPYTGPMGGGMAFQLAQEQGDQMWGTTYELRARGGMDAGRMAIQAQYITGADSTSGSVNDSRSLAPKEKAVQAVMEMFR